MTDGEATPKLAFLIAGMARSGTTLVQRMASELESVWVPAETHFWRYAATLASKYSWPLDRSLVEEAIGWLRSRESFPKAHFETGRALDALTDEIFLWDLFQAVVIGLSPPDAEILGEKTPDHLLWAEHLLDSKPDLRVIAVIRDPREVLRSQRSVPWGIHDPAAFTEKWLHLARCIEDCRRLFPDRVLAIKYEDAARVPEETRKEIAQFVGVSTAIEDVTNRRYSLFPESEWWKHHSVDPIEPQADTWQDLLSPSDVEIIESRAAETMQVWGYVPVSTPRDSGMTAAARQMRIALRRASSQVLPVTSAQLDAWNATDTARATRWEERARELQLDLRGERTARKALEGWQRQAEELRRTLTHLREINEATVQRLNESERAVSAWKVRASEMQRAHQRSELQRLRAELRYRKTAGQLRRLRARRWWRLAGVLSRWRHAPWRVLTLFREGWNTVFGPSELPNPPDVRTIAARIERLEKQLALAPQQGLEAARRAFSSGEYERALELINESPEDIRTSVEALTLANGCYVRMGELSQGLKVMRALLRVKNDRKLEWQARFQEGRLIETDPRWLPDVGMPKSDEAIVPRPQTVLHILKESLPYFERGTR